MTLEDSMHAFRLRVMARAQEMRDVSQACREFGISRSLFYRWRERYLAYGLDGLHPPGARGPVGDVLRGSACKTSGRSSPWRWLGRPGVRLSYPTNRVAPNRAGRRPGSPQHDLPETRWERLAVLEVHSAQAAGLLTECTRCQLTAAQRRRPALAGFSGCRLAAPACADRSRQPIPEGLRQGLPRETPPPQPHPASARLDQWLCGTGAGHHSQRTLAHRVPPALLHKRSGYAGRPRWLSRLLQPPPFLSRIPDPRPNTWELFFPRGGRRDYRQRHQGVNTYLV